jgi:elongation factor 1-gamma
VTSSDACKQTNPRTVPILAVAKANNIELELVETNNVKAGIGSPPGYLKLNPLGKIPTFEGKDGYVLTECIAIAIYSTFEDSQSGFPFLYDETYYHLQLSLSEDYC